MLFLCYHCENNLFMEQKNVDYPFRFDLCTCCNTAVALPSKECLKFIVAVSIEHAKFSEGTSNINLWFRAESMFIPDLCRLKIKHFSCSNLIPVALISPNTKLVLGQIYSGPPPSPCAIQTSCRVGATYTLPWPFPHHSSSHCLLCAELGLQVQDPARRHECWGPEVQFEWFTVCLPLESLPLESNTAVRSDPICLPNIALTVESEVYNLAVWVETLAHVYRYLEYVGIFF